MQQLLIPLVYAGTALDRCQGEGARAVRGGLNGLVAAGAVGDAAEQSCGEADKRADGNGDSGVNAEVGTGGVDEGEEAQDEGECAGGGWYAQQRDASGEQEGEDRGDEEGEGCGAQGLEREAVDAGEKEEETGGSREDGPGEVGLEEEEEGAEAEGEDGDVGDGEKDEEVNAGQYGPGKYGGWGERREKGAHGMVWPRVWRACFMPRAALLEGSRRRALPTSEAEAPSWLPLSSIRARTR